MDTEQDWRELWEFIKGNMVMLALIIIVFAGAVVWTNYQHHIDDRYNAMTLLSEHYWDWPPELRAERERIMREYNITNEDINPARILGLER